MEDVCYPQTQYWDCDDRRAYLPRVLSKLIAVIASALCQRHALARTTTAAQRSLKSHTKIRTCGAQCCALRRSGKEL